MTVAKVAVEQFPRRVSGLGLQLLHFGIHVPVTYENVRPAVVVEIKKAAAPAQKLGVRTQTRRESRVFKTTTTLIVVQRGSVAGEIGFDQVQVSVEIIVAGGNSHAGLRLAVRTESAPGLDSNVLKF